jgi:hypothetical protein
MVTWFETSNGGHAVAVIYFRIPFTEYFLGKHVKLCIFRKVFKGNKTPPYVWKKI